MDKEKIVQSFENINDLKNRKLNVNGTEVEIYFVDSMCSNDKITEYVTKPLMMLNKKVTAETCLSKIIFGADCELVNSDSQIREALLSGKTVLFVANDKQAVAVDTKGVEYRAISEPPTSMVTKGPREGFVENIKTNVMLLRKRLKTTEFKTESLVVGELTKTQVLVCFIDKIANPSIIKKVTDRIKAIKIDGVLDSSYISSYLNYDKSNILKMVGSCEKPDIVVSKLLEGKVAIIVDGSPIVLTVPYMFIEDVQSPDDYYYDSPQIATVSRIIRLLSMVFAVLLPSIYVSLQLFNYQILPSKFLITITSAVQGIPFAPLMEMLVVILLFDLLREANARMPQIAGLSLSVVGAIILGDAAVNAGLLGAPAVMIGALSGIGLYTMPDNTMVFTLLRLGFTFLGGVIGILGILLGVMFLISYAVSLKDFGTPYLAPFAPSVSNDKKDAILKKSLVELNKREASAMSVGNSIGGEKNAK